MGREGVWGGVGGVGCVLLCCGGGVGGRDWVGWHGYVRGLCGLGGFGRGWSGLGGRGRGWSGLG